ncbi:hypothetical protein MYSTI_06896 [Myxococcus stipitatus DSM 14675]|uniref:Uncharacterized protein n=1 Tax=Myxococcus stipitatus (strain DSM 14675 / JCM 12634 / Mx s8) TaxID=1278073 RepID=L7UNV4_MYXSD|nr:hypothetical protein [Myxococcus stipitatus]AGC48169.1 hypothetical protein MYSTI_06896 [Myxococcus stipitatus DSM 14675]
MTLLRLDIEALELEGLEPAGRFEFARGMESELARLVLDGGVPSGLLAGRGALAPLEVAPPAAAAPADLGRAVARALYEGWR